MPRHRRTDVVALAALALAAACADPAAPERTAPDLARNPYSQGIARVREVGDPIWRPVDFHLFTAPAGTPESGFAEFLETARRIYPEPYYTLDPATNVFLRGGAITPPPYDRELEAALARLGFEDDRTFSASDFGVGSNRGVFFTFTIVPDPGVIGSSENFASGPIIPNELFPIVLTGVAYRNDEVFDGILMGPGGLTIPALHVVDPRFPEREGWGWSHQFVGNVETLQFYPFEWDGVTYPRTAPQGRYRYEIQMRDAAGNGWDVTTRYVVKKK